YLNRLDLNRSLPSYPLPTLASAGQMDLTNPLTLTQFLVAQTARQQMAQDIYNVLRAVTGAGDPAVVGPTGTGSDPGQFNALRWLAQLAVNIVDYIDADDIMTPFNWFTDTTTTPPTPHWVYGTELPHVLLNEAVAAYTDPGAGLPAN